MKIALISLSGEGANLLKRLQEGFPEAVIFLSEGITGAPFARRFKSIMDLTREIFNQFEGLVYATSCGIVVRAIALNLQGKTTDPAVVVVDSGGRYAISLLSGHEGGANDLAIRVGNLLRAEPVITTTTEALKAVIVGIGCRRGTTGEAIEKAVRAALRKVGVEPSEVRLLATADIKARESGLIQAAAMLGIPLRLISSEEIRSSIKPFTHFDRVKEKVNLPAVAEPAALLAGRRTRLILPRTTIGGITVAVARESSGWSGLDPEIL